MSRRTFQLVLQYDGEAFAGWQRQPAQRTVQGVLEEGLARLMQLHVPVIGAGRTDAGVHAMGQAASIQVPEKWEPERLHRALNAVLPRDVRCARVQPMMECFHARFSATERQYRYLVGTDADAAGPFRFFMDTVLPLSMTTIAALFVIQFIYGWNQYLWPLLITTKDSMSTIVIGIKKMIVTQDALTEWQMAMATAVLALMPPVIVVISMQRLFVRGLVETEK